MTVSLAPKHQRYDVVIIGGAMYGSAVAWFLRKLGFDGRVLVVERDPTYAQASTSHTNSCIRQQFSNETNVRISQFGAAFMKSFQSQMDDDPRVPNIAIQSYGYMYLAGDQSAVTGLAEAQRIQAAGGAATRHMSAAEIKETYPFYNVDDILAGNHNLVDEGYFDGGTMFYWFRKSAGERGVEFVRETVVAMTRNAGGSAVDSVTLASGAVVSSGVVVNCTGPRAAQTVAMAGISIPVEPRKRYTFIFDAATPLEQDLPLTIDPSGVHMRSDGRYYLAGCPPDDDPAVAPDDFAFDHSLWENKVWPALAHRVPQFEAVRVINEWVGHYDYNVFDQNAIIGPHDKLANFYFANGFSGHGLQQAPALARGLAEMILFGEYRTLDLRAFHFDRIEQGARFVEKAVI